MNKVKPVYFYNVMLQPQDAREWRKCVVPDKDRPFKPHHSQRLQGTVRRDEWKLNGDTIRDVGPPPPCLKGVKNGQIYRGRLKPTKQSQIIDGQHRLHTIEMTGRTLPVSFAFGVDPECWDTIDQGLRRSMVDTLKQRKEQYYVTLAGAINWFLHKGRDDAALGTVTANATGLHILERNPGLRKSVRYIMVDCEFEKMTIIPGGMAAALHYTMRKKDRAKADRFFYMLGTGEKLTKTSPVRLLRNRLIQQREALEKFDRRTKYRMTIKAWNAYVRGQRLTSIKLTDADLKPVIH